MILDEIGADHDLWPDAERYLGVGTRTYSAFSADLDVDDAYHPQRGSASFAIRTFWIPHGQGAFLTNGISSDLPGLYRRDERFLLPVHPQTLSMLGDEAVSALRGHEPGPELTVVPSANVRTVFVTAMSGRAAPPHFVKLHYPRRLSRFTRRLRRPIISVQLWVSAELDRIGAPHLPEVGAGVFGTEPTQAWGYLLRERRLAATAPLARTVPVFALYGTDVRAPGDPTLLSQLVARSATSPVAFLTERVVRPMVRLWARAATQTGCALEMHGQNTLFGFSSDASSTVVGYRDCGVYVDQSVRADLGLSGPLPPINVIGRDVAYPREQVFSLAYDSFLGHHTLDFLARSAQATFGVDPQALREAARDEFHARPGAAELLAPTVYYYDDQLHPDGGWRLVDTGEAPGWR